MAGLGARDGSDSLGSEIREHTEVPPALPSCRLASSTEQALRREGWGPYDVRTQPIGGHVAVGSKAWRRLRDSSVGGSDVVPVRHGVG